MFAEFIRKIVREEISNKPSFLDLGKTKKEAEEFLRNFFSEMVNVDMLADQIEQSYRDGVEKGYRIGYSEGRRRFVGRVRDASKKLIEEAYEQGKGAGESHGYHRGFIDGRHEEDKARAKTPDAQQESESPENKDEP